MSILDRASFPMIAVIIFVESTREEIHESFVKGSGLENERISFLHTKGSEQGLETSSLWKYIRVNFYSNFSVKSYHNSEIFANEKFQKKLSKESPYF